jgi:hypothetical protein
MTVKYLHVRKLDEDNNLSSNGGVTVAYTCTLTEICLAYALCHDNDRFCYDIARRITKGRLLSPKYDTYIIPLKHPITYTIVDWISKEIFEEPINIFLDDKYRWVSDFFPDDGVVVDTDGDWQNQVQLELSETNHPPRSMDDGFESEGAMRYDG